MRVLRKGLLALVFFCALCFSAGWVVHPVRVQAAAAKTVKTGLVTVKGKRYYYTAKGKMVTNTWKTLKDGKKKYKFYFGKDGAAYRAKTVTGVPYMIKVYTIKGKKYAFDKKGHMMTGVLLEKANTYSPVISIFKSNGVFNKTKTTKIRKLTKSGKASKTLYRDIVKLLGKPRSERRGKSCNPLDAKDSYTDINLVYQYFEIQMIMNDRTKVITMDTCFPNEK